jgi:glycosyltransferase involved in cell wall biosynthesis
MATHKGVQMNARRISVIVPTCDRPGSLRRALASIRAVEGRDLELQIIVADNGEALETKTVAAEYGATCLSVEQKGPSAARNTAMAVADGDYIAFLDDDDAWTDKHLRQHLNLFEADETLDLVIGQVISTDENYQPFGDPWLADPPEPGPDLLRRMLSGYFPQIGSVMIRARVRDEIGGFDPGLVGGEDLDWLLRIAERGRVAFVSVPCVFFTHRDIGTFDELQLHRIKYDKLVFRRYALRWWWLWRSPMEYSRAYSGTLMHYYRYFADSALERAKCGERARALKAVFHAATIFPLRAIKHLCGDTKLRQAVSLCLLVRVHPAQIQLPFWLAIVHC